MDLFQCASLLALTSWSLTFHLVISEGPEDVTAYLGDNVTLSCQSINGVPVIALEWTRSDLEKLEYVFLYRDGRPHLTYQHPSFKNRVKLSGEMKNGDLTLILKNVTKDDNGTYECRIKAERARRRKRAVIPSAPISIINLKVLDRAVMAQQDNKDPDPEGPAGRGHAAVGVVVPLALIAAAAVVVFVRRRKQRPPESVSNIT